MLCIKIGLGSLCSCFGFVTPYFFISTTWQVWLYALINRFCLFVSYFLCDLMRKCEDEGWLHLTYFTIVSSHLWHVMYTSSYWHRYTCLYYITNLLSFGSIMSSLFQLIAVKVWLVLTRSERECSMCMIQCMYLLVKGVGADGIDCWKFSLFFWNFMKTLTHFYDNLLLLINWYYVFFVELKPVYLFAYVTTTS